MNTLRNISLLLMSLVLTLGVAGGESDYLIDTYSIRDGLSNNNINYIYKDTEGFMWFGTWDGLSRFDGADFKSYNAINHPELKSARIINIREDAAGYLWVLTYDRELYRFDKRREQYEHVPMPVGFQYGGRHFDTQGNVWIWSRDHALFHVTPDVRSGSLGRIIAHPRIGDTQINFVAEIDGRLLAGTNAALYEIFTDPARDRVVSDAYNNAGYSAYIASEGGKTCFGTLSTGVIEYDPANGALSVLPGTEIINEITAINRTDTLLLVGTRKQGLYLYNMRQMKIVAHHDEENDPVFKSNFITRIARESDRFWIQNQKPGMILYDAHANTFRYLSLDTEPNQTSVGSFLRKYGDKVIVNSFKQGLALYDPATERFDFFYKEIASDPGLFSLSVHHVFIDQQQTIWLSPWSKKLYKISRQRNRIDYITPTDSRQDMANEVRAINENRDGDLWVGTREGGLFCYDRNRQQKHHIRYYTGRDGRQHRLSAVYAILIQSDDEVWLGTKGEGIIRVVTNGRTATATQMDIKDLSKAFVYALQKDRYGRIWIGTFGTGLMVLEKENDRYVLHDQHALANYPSHHHQSIRTLLIDRKDNMWIGTTDGLLSFGTRRKQLADIDVRSIEGESPEKIAFSDVHAIREDQRGIVWVGSTGGGLAAVEQINGEDEPRYAIRRYSTNDGLPSNSIIALCEDDAGGLWIGTEENVCRFSYPSGKFYTFTRNDGFRNQTITEKCAFTTTLGHVIFGTTEGFFVFDPLHIKTDTSTFNLVITDFRILNTDEKPRWKDGRYVLRHNQSFFNIEYAALDYTGGENIQYSYMMEGLDPAWNAVKGERKATYTKLPAGKYTFKVIASKDSAFNEEDPMRTLDITVLHPWWNTNLAKFVYGLLVLAFFYLMLRVLSHFYQMRHRAKFEKELHEMKLRFFTNISHELRTPMTLMIGPLEKLLSQPSISPENIELIRYVDRNTRKLLGIVNQILDFRKVQNEKMEVHRANMELIGFARNIFNNLSPAAAEKQINFSFSTNTPQLDVSMDSRMIDTIIQNLLSNAIKFTPEHGEIMLAIRFLKDQEMVEIVVKDNGIGIEKEMIPALFDRFSSFSFNYDIKYRGTGIGLNLVKSFAELHGGSAEVESVVGRGSTFTVRLPHKQQPTDDKPIEKPSHVLPKSAAKVLVVDDNPELRGFLYTLLSDKYNVIEAGSGEEAIGVIREQLPDLVISDIMMPGIDGIELLKLVRGDIKTSHILFILLSAKGSVEDQIAGIEYGADDYIVKPFNTKLLQSKIDNVFERRTKHYSEIAEGYNAVPLYPDVVVCQKRDEELLRKVISMIDENMQQMNDFNIDDIVHSVGLSRTVFYKKIKSLTGLSPIELVRDIRIKRGAQLIQSGEYTVSEVSMMVGFNDVRYFSRCFRAKYGVNPSEYKPSNESKKPTE